MMEFFFYACNVSMYINKISLEHFQAWHSNLQVLMEKWILHAQLGQDQF